MYQLTKEAGYGEALYGIGLNKKITSPYKNWSFVPDEIKTRMHEVSLNLAKHEGGHNNFLEMIYTWWIVELPLFQWKQMDRYRVGKSQQSESTMHTLMKYEITQRNFYKDIPEVTLAYLNELRTTDQKEQLNNDLPQGYLQKRVLCVNYKCLRNIYLQRKPHQLAVWRDFCKYMMENLKYPEYFEVVKNEKLEEKG